MDEEKRKAIDKRRKMLGYPPRKGPQGAETKKQKKRRRQGESKKQQRLIAEASASLGIVGPDRPPKQQCISYAERHTNLRQIGFKSYLAYLKSPLWREIRRKVFQKRGDCCECCGEDGCNVIHHIDYDLATLLGKQPWRLLVICGRCHRGIEFDDKGCKVSLTGAQKRLAEFSRDICVPCCGEPF